MSKIANYDTLNYDYRQYWKNREYENKSEHIALNSLLKQYKGNWFIDIGGSYGRLTPTYYDKYTNPVIIDYSLKTLQNNYQYIKDNYPNTELIAANAYNLPFKDNSFDGGLMVRVLHHIDRPLDYFKEAHRVFSNNSIYIQEYANKKHLKAVIKSLITFDFSIFNKEPYQQPTKENYEGARKGSHVPFLNYHPKWIKENLKKSGFIVAHERGSSFLRLNILKKILGVRILLLLERIFQNIFSWCYISPSVFVKNIVNKADFKTSKNSTLEEILVCPLCKGFLRIEKDTAHCKECKKIFRKEKNIWDFRV